MIAVLSAGPSMAVIHMPRPAAGPPWWFSLHPSIPLVTFALWTAAGTGGARGHRGPLRRGARRAALRRARIIVFSFLVVAILTVLPAGGSTDVLSYAANGRMAATGHSPYVMTPLELKNSGDPIGQWIPPSWQTNVSVYGPVATAEEWVAAELGGTSVARVTFWLKLLTSIAFGAVALMLDRVLRPDPARRLRAHLLWTVNPLLLWEIVAGGHIDGLSAAFGLLGILVLTTGPNGERPALRRNSCSPACSSGSPRPSRSRTLRSGSGCCGPRASRSRRWRRDRRLRGCSSCRCTRWRAARHRGADQPWPGTTWDTMYQIFYRPLGYQTFGAFIMPPNLTLVAALAFGAVAILAFLRFPDATPSLPALSPALALSLAWLFMWSYQRPWYDVMAMCLLAVYPASRLDWLVLGAPDPDGAGVLPGTSPATRRLDQPRGLRRRASISPPTAVSWWPWRSSCCACSRAGEGSGAGGPASGPSGQRNPAPEATDLGIPASRQRHPTYGQTFRGSICPAGSTLPVRARLSVRGEPAWAAASHVRAAPLPAFRTTRLRYP